MFIGMGMPIPDLSNKPGPGRPGWPTGSALEFKMEIQGPATLSFNASKSAGGTNFSIDWGDTTVASGLTGTSHSHTYAAGTFTLAINSKDDTGPIDTFQLTGTQLNKNALKKILNWGTTPWVNLTSAFQNCYGLTNIDKSDFYSDVAVNLTSAFENCNNLTTVDFTGWKATGLTSLSSWFKDCTSLTSFLMKGNINLNPSTANHNSLFENSGAATGCSFDMDSINFSTTTGSQQTKQWFYNSNIKIDSKLTNWTFPAANWNLEDFFYDANIIGSNETLDISNWTLPNNSSTSLKEMFRNFSVNGTGAEQVVNMTNWNFGSIGVMNGFLQGTGIRRITGLSTWIANGLTNISNILNGAVNFSIDVNDNFSSSFWNNSNISTASTMFFNMGSLTDASSAGAFPNLSGATFTNTNFWTQTFFSCHFNTNASFSGVNFNGGDYKFLESFKLAEFFNSNSTIDFSSSTVSFSNVESAFRQCKVDNIIFGDNIDFSNCTSFRFSFRSTADSTVTYPMPTVTFPINSNRPNYSSATNTDSYPAIDFSTCQADNLLRALHDTGGNAAGNATTFNLKDSQVTAAPSVVNSYLDNILPSRGWTMTANSTDAALPFSYPSYAFDPSSTTSVTPNLIPSGAVFSTTTSGVTVNATTGVVSWASTFSGNINVKCTYPDGCYNEVVILIQVPFTMRTKIPAGSTNFELKPQMSAGECFVDWGDGNSQTLTANTTHSYASSGSDQEYDIKLFDSPSGSKFTGFSIFGATEASYERTILKWGDIEWQNNSWFGTSTTGDYRIRLAAPNGSDYKPNLSQVTSLSMMFGTVSNDTNIGTGFFEDTNDNLEHWDVSTITDMENMFRNPDPISTKVSGAENLLKCGNWDVSNVTNFKSFMRGYSGAVRGSWSTQTNIDMTNWDTSSATDMSFMFWQHSKNKTGIENFRTENVTNLSHFYGGGTWNAKTKIYNSILRWDVSNVEDFSSASIVVGANETDVNANYPSNWKFSTDATKNLNFNKFCGGHYMRLGGGPYYLTDLQAFSTKTINETFYGGTSYTAWNMDNASNISEFGGSSFRGNPPLGLFRNYNIAGWNITSKCTSFYNLWVSNRAASGAAIPFDQDLSGWNVTGITGDQGYFMRGAENAPLNDVNISTSNYDDILTSWGALAASVNSGVTVNFGTSQYTPGISIEGTTNNTGTSTTIYDSTKNFTNEGSAGNIAVGDILYNKDTNEYAKVLSFGTYTVVTDQSIWGSSGINYRVENSNAARGKIALINAGWTITDGGAYIPPVVPLQLQFTVVSNTQTQIDIPYVQGTSFTVDWGDGFTETSTGSNNRTLSHTYNDGNNTNVTNPTVSINAQGDLNPLTGFNFSQSGGGSRALLIDIPAWGNTPFTYVQSLLSGCSNLNTLSATDAPIITASSFYNMLGGTGTLGNADLTSWDVSSATYTGYMFSGSQFNGNISNWDVSNVTNMSYMFNGAAFSGDISSWDVREVTDASRQFIGISGNPDITGWFYEKLTTAYFWAWSASSFNPGPFKIGATVTNQNWKYMHNGTSWSTNNWTDFLVLNANAANARSPKTPLSALLSPGTNGKTFDTTRTYSTGFPNGGRAYSFLTADVTVSGGSSAINGVYAYNYTTQKWVRDGDSEKTIEWNAEESVWEVLSAGVSQHVGSGGTQGNGPESSTSWTGGITVVDSSMGWSISNSLIT